MKSYGIIYCITNRINCKKYIGQTVRSLKERWKDHCKSLKKGEKTYLYNAIRKYGITNFIIEFICECPDRDSLNNQEKYYISKYETFDSNKGYNLTRGGFGSSGFKILDETKKKMSKSHLGKKRSPHTEETKRKISESKKGKLWTEEIRKKHKEARKGYKHTEETKNKISKNNIGKHLYFLGKKHTEETKKKQSKARKIYWQKRSKRTNITPKD